MIEVVRELIQKYKTKGIIVDSNLLLFYLIGAIDLGRIKQFHRTKNFAEEDFTTLQNILQNFNTIVTTPNILTEVSNFLGQLKKDLHALYYRGFANSIDLLDERYVASNEVAKMPGFSWLHLTDSGIVDLAKNAYLVITVDAPLAVYLGRQGIDVINFNHIRPDFWQ
ncbi:MAG: hypothetical protein KDJ52_20160 [Anaerolineae bacterium]|nr:hypothetical protein [Anaerolineae bacterium]